MLCFSFLIFGSLFTRIGREKKERLGIAEARGGARGIANLWGAAGVPAICAVCACIADIFFLKRYVYIGATVSSCMRVAYVAALAAKFADTTSSEIGKAFGSTTYLPINMKMVPNGTEGAVSVEGSVAGISAAVVTAVAGLALRLLPMEWTCVVVVVVAATVANVAESFIGCYQKEIGWSNEFVNFVNTAISALIAACAWALVLVLGQ